MDRLQSTLRAADARDWRAYLDELAWLDRRSWHGDDVAEADGPEFLRSDPGYPLGRGFPLGSTLRADGESHLDAWATLVRADGCAYCGDRASTTDHVDARPFVPRDAWVNYTGSCETCNRSKGDTRLLLWLAHRLVLSSPARR